MATTINESRVWPEIVAAGVERKRLLTSARVPRTRALLDRVTLAPGAAIEMRVSAPDLAWIQVLHGDMLLVRDSARLALGETHVVLLPPGFAGTLASKGGAAFLHGQVPDGARSGGADDSPRFRVVDWSREPVLDSEHDARKRIYLVTPRLFGSRAVKGELIIYPPGTQAASHHHEGAGHFMYVLKGCGTAYADGRPIALRPGELIHYEEREQHHVLSEGVEDLVFVEFFVPGVYRTVWAQGAPVCTWKPTGRDIRGATPVREIAGHSSAVAVPHDV